ncbi:MAG: hypothetical protein K1X82_09355 [Bacteroidia bacterium]|nr:hypothetical protein [Bacteroidia bacterium]
MENVPSSLTLLFASSTFISLFFFWKAAKYSRSIFLLALFWIGFQSALAVNGFYLQTNSFPPRVGLMIIPPLIAILLVFLLPNGKRFTDGLDPKMLCLIHTVRIPVEIGLYALFTIGLVPADMTFEGGNFDIFSGLSAPFIYWFGYHKKQLNHLWLLIWNLLCLALLFNVVSKGILSAPSLVQQLNFNQPNRAVLYFPINFLPAIIVPLVLFSHLVLLRKK